PRALNPAEYPVTLLRSGVNTPKLVVVQNTSHRAHLREHSHGFCAGERRAHSTAKRIAPAIPYGRESESGFVFRARSVCVVSHDLKPLRKAEYRIQESGVRIKENL